MILPEGLFILSPRDLAGFAPIPYYRRALISLASATISTSFTIPLDSILLLSRYVLRMQGGGAQTVVEGNIRILDANSTPLCNIAGVTPAAPPNLLTEQGSLDLITPAGVMLQAFGTFSAGVAANAMQFDLAGWLLPRGNLGGV